MTVRNALRIDHMRGPKSVSAPSSQAASHRPAWAPADPDDSSMATPKYFTHIIEDISATWIHDVARGRAMG
jgi:hypothetical protein